MIWNVQSKDQTVRLTPTTLMEQLLGRIQKSQKQDVEALTLSFGEFSSKSGLMLRRSYLDSLYLAMMVGYYYKVFLDKNKVTIEDEETTTTEPADTTSTN